MSLASHPRMHQTLSRATSAAACAEALWRPSAVVPRSCRPCAEAWESHGKAEMLILPGTPKYEKQWPKPSKMAPIETILHTFGVQIGFKHTSLLSLDPGSHRRHLTFRLYQRLSRLLRFQPSAITWAATPYTYCTGLGLFKQHSR